ncbi:MAG: hypothetical protein OMOMHJEC_03319 [Xanthomonadales bacterium]|nr:hypothetical protein [Xanthomonadales bacterium]
MKHTLFIAIALLLGTAHAAHVDGVYKYSSFGMEAENWGDPLFIMVGEKPKNMSPFVGAGSEAEGAKFCSEDDANICVASRRLTFAVPKKRVSSGDEWEFNNFTFSVATELDIELLGRKAHVYRILARSRSSFRWVFIYSYELGLVLIEEHAESNKASVVYLLANEVGFGGKMKSPSDEEGQ